MRMMNVAYNNQFSGVLDSSTFGGVTDGKIAHILMSGIASDKIGYCVREISTNAWEAGKGKFHVSLPTRFSATFRVRDYGPGLSHDFMMRDYVKFGMSTKDGDDDAIGGWGLGSKSPFAYLIGGSGAGSYNVRSFQDGMVRTYVMSISDGGMPQITLLDESPTDEANGIEVAIPVRREDVDTFRLRARSILWFFDPRPSVDEDSLWNKPETYASGDGWTEYKRGTVPFDTAHVRMGCVGYPIDMQRLGYNDPLEIKNRPLVIDVPIGSVKVTASREDLQYDDATKKAVLDALDKFQNAWLAGLQAEFDKNETYLEACKAYQKIVTDYYNFGDRRRQLVRNTNFYWRNQAKGLVDNIIFTDLTQVAYSQIGSTGSRPIDSRFIGTGKSLRIDRMEDTVLIDTRPSGAMDRIAALKLPVGTKFVWIRHDGHPDDIAKKLDHFEIKYIRLNEVATPRTKPKLFHVRHVDSDRLIRARFDENEAHYYIEIDHYGKRDGWRPVRDFTDWGHVQWVMRLLGIDKVLCIPREGEDAPDAFKKLATDALPAVEALIDWTYLSHNTINKGHPLWDASETLMKSKSIAWPDDIKDVLDDIRAFKGKMNLQPPADNTKWMPVYRQLGGEKAYTIVKDEQIQTKIQTVSDKYPALTYLIRDGLRYSFSGLTSELVSVINHYFDVMARAAR